MDKVCTLMATCLEACILWPYGDLRFFSLDVVSFSSEKKPWPGTGRLSWQGQKRLAR